MRAGDQKPGCNLEWPNDDTKILKSRRSGFSRGKLEAGRNELGLCTARDESKSWCFEGLARLSRRVWRFHSCRPHVDTLSSGCGLGMRVTSNECSLSSLVSHSLLQYGAVPLGIAAHKGHTETVQRLLEAGANVNHQNKVMTHNC